MELLYFGKWNFYAQAQKIKKSTLRKLFIFREMEIPYIF